MKRLTRAQEIAEHITQPSFGAKQVKTTHSDLLVQLARELEKLLSRRRKARRELRKLEADIKHKKSQLRKMIAEVSNRREEEL